MKYLILSIAIFTIYSCKSSIKPKKTTYTVTDWQAVVPVNIQTFDGGVGWVKMVVYKDSLQDNWKLNSDGDTIHLKSITSDTFYFLRTADTKLPLKDSAGVQKIDPTTHQPLYYLSWRNVYTVPKDVITPLKPIPSRFFPSLYSSIPSPDTNTQPQQPPAPPKHLIIK